jgi:hypothetical protein
LGLSGLVPGREQAKDSPVLVRIDSHHFLLERLWMLQYAHQCSRASSIRAFHCFRRRPMSQHSTAGLGTARRRASAGRPRRPPWSARVRSWRRQARASRCSSHRRHRRR